MNLVVDIGNTRVKAAVFDEGRLVEVGDMDVLLAKYPVDRAIVSSVRGATKNVAEMLRGRGVKCLTLGADTPLPIANLYRTPSTLGPDRIAAAVGANALYPGENLLVVDLGTAITFDMVTAAGEFAGGNISPGADMRFRALHEQTAGLPLVDELDDPSALFGTTTAEAIAAGVVNGILFEIEGYAARSGAQRIIFTGGRGKLFAERTKSTIFVERDLVLFGLNRILEYNE